MILSLRRVLPLAISTTLIAGSATAQCLRAVITFPSSARSGQDVDVHGEWLAVGFPTSEVGSGPGEKSNGTVYVLRRIGPGDYQIELTLHGGDGHGLGNEVALDLPALLVTAPHASTPGGLGTVQIYERDGSGTWTAQGTFNPGLDELGEGADLAGDWAFAPTTGPDVLVLMRSALGWAEHSVAQLGGDELGMSGTHLLVAGASATLAYELIGGTWQRVQSLPGAALAGVTVEGDQAVVRTGNDLRVYDWDGSQWQQSLAITGGEYTVLTSEFGISPELFAYGERSNEMSTDSGRTIVYRREGSAWSFFAALVPDQLPGDGSFEYLGRSTAVSGREVISTARSELVVHEIPDWLSTFCHCDAGAPCDNPDPVRGCAGSSGFGAYLAGCGSASVSADDLVLAAGLLPAGQSGIVFMGAGAIDLPFGDGRRCVGSGGVGTFRFPVHAADGDRRFVEGPGIVAYAATRLPAAGHIDPGDTWYFQAWYRDPSGPCGSGFNLSNAVGVPFAP